MESLANSVKRLGLRPGQVQEFTPTPMTLATTMYYTGMDPYARKALYVARGNAQKQKQKSYFFR